MIDFYMNSKNHIKVMIKISHLHLYNQSYY